MSDGPTPATRRSKAAAPPAARAAAPTGGAGSLFARMALRFLAIDVLIAAFLALIWPLVYGTRDPSGALLLFVALFLLRSAIWLVGLWTGLRPITPWLEQRTALDEGQLRAVEAALAALPRRMDVLYGLGLAVYMASVIALAWTTYPDALLLGRGDLLSVGLQLLSVVLATPISVRVLTLAALDSTRAELAAELAARGLGTHTTSGKLHARFNMTAVLLVAVPLTWLASMAWLVEVRSTRDAVIAEQRRVVELAVRDQQGGHAIAAELELVDALPPALTDPTTAVELGISRAAVELHSEVATVAAPTRDGRWIIARQAVGFTYERFALTTIASVLILIIWGLVGIGSLTRSFLAAIARLNHAVRRVVEVGDFVAMGPIPTLGDDEIGGLTHDFNRLLKDLVGLAATTQAVANGDLSVRLRGNGDLPEAFRSMLEQLHEVVTQIRETSVGLATAASEIHAATQEQETASEQLATGMRDVSRTMDSLASSATQIDGATKGVLDNAEGTLATTDEMARKIGELSEHTKGIVELLEVIRDVADRSDLLALNGSLEATRAGEAGRGFALVAAEMRRLAERVTGTVANVRELVADIKSSTATTVMATEQSRRLAENTAAAARQITDETRRQSTETGQASLNVREVANIIAQTSVATTQTRAAAEGLMGQAEMLEQLIHRFELRDDDDTPRVATAPESLRSTALAEAKRRFS